MMEKRGGGFKLSSILGIILPIFFYYPTQSLASIGVSVATGHGVSDIVPIRIGLQKEFNRRWCPSNTWPVSGYFESAFYFLNGKAGPQPNSHHKAFAVVAAAAVFRFERPENFYFAWPYLELGVGVSYFNHKEIGGRQLGIRPQFEDRVGLGFRFGEKRQFDISYRLVHFSNAYTGPQNNGVNLQLIVFGYWFH